MVFISLRCPLNLQPSASNRPEFNRPLTRYYPTKHSPTGSPTVRSAPLMNGLQGSQSGPQRTQSI
ncbi:MAG: hypothetical protein RL373_902 [Pseudomonadota bacterium]|jgi:hypothetical protein